MPFGMEDDLCRSPFVDIDIAMLQVCEFITGTKGVKCLTCEQFATISEAIHDLDKLTRTLHFGSTHEILLADTPPWVQKLFSYIGLPARLVDSQVTTKQLRKLIPKWQTARAHFLEHQDKRVQHLNLLRPLACSAGDIADVIRYNDHQTYCESLHKQAHLLKIYVDHFSTDKSAYFTFFNPYIKQAERHYFNEASMLNDEMQRNIR